MTLLRSARVPVLALIGGLGLACADPTAPLNTEVGYFDVIQFQDGAFFTTTPVAFFFKAADVEPPTSVVTIDRCEAGVYQTPVSNALVNITAGPSISVAINEIEASLTPGLSGGIPAYLLPPETSLEFVPGDTITFEVPSTSTGAAPRTVQGRTAEAFVPAPITEPSGSEPVAVTWTEWDEETELLPGSAIFYSFRYARAPSTELNREVGCVFINDGSATVSNTLMQEFFESNNREIEATRLRVASFRVGTVISVIAARLSLPVSGPPTQ